MFIKTHRKVIIGASVLATVGLALVTGATHSWGGYHWARTANPFTLKLGDNVSGAWDSYLGTSSADWSESAVLDTTIVAGGTDPRRCKPTLGRVEVCNSKYGKNGWLGIAGIYVKGGHITQGYVKVNDTYFNTAKYNTPAWRNLVLCQEVGHTLGLDHQDEDFYNSPLGTCMDYSLDPTLNQHPNQHDYDMLETIYAHLDSMTTIKASAISGKHADVDPSDPKEWGKELRKSKDGKASLFERDLGKGHKLFTFVFWAK
ncbi:hypothetical protein A2W54_01220 [Candidatus Giovannonibacteria bacterium RIFCSPHIGHO2_02_43_13]|uniref:Peptidase M10 metallopeptidase domain-containing protein n=1 Tax=Candidatus Giovannonibacteria bacterium RIFCSPHIGHO2_02_43_13 TaxID=1798330 RepID=A0A1F5WUK8_9BACT|nr:MAG: hypothetical protein UW28_C0001G0004 [Parcubacteria group bacterium GW2011_GWA2_44_13]OGF72980.1 MAG: hypothetical protein A3E06_03295 [Candidatus Giovannonibacteria bacterium RIFCSPHIGHO2_12_FULL_44_42]OGF79335.1 MAG: hypothetical protein A2W54_01220 [Candidatus Giovannonibacteria bacterium RIFCSPHIGHO2_02_43_13]OGF90278.1 MAG: hypothetical protein A3I94_01630 [Candidatus Giovannonibacteria bacterium RIFCSPLOWO2_02_FULL_43_54]OGF97260.1 MAG: hypothetical protein A3H08_02800 [Candidatus